MMKELERKATAAPAGTGRALVTTYNRVHVDRDVVRPGSLRNRHATVSGQAHAAARGAAAPVGFAALSEDQTGLWADVTWFDGEAAACEASRDAEWSVSFRVLESHPPTAEERAAFPGVERIIDAWIVGEVSPVENPAAPGTGSGQVCCDGRCTVGGKACCSECEQREAAVRELGRFEFTKHRFFVSNLKHQERQRRLEEAMRPKHWSEIAEEHEIPAWKVHALRQDAAAKGIALALAALDAADDQLPVKWFRRETPDEPWGFSSPRDPIWISDELDCPETAETAAHEVAHHLGHRADAAADRIAKLVRAAYVSGRRIYSGHWRKFQNRPDSKPGDIVLSPDLSVAWMRRDVLNWDPI